MNLLITVGFIIILIILASKVVLINPFFEQIFTHGFIVIAFLVVCFCSATKTATFTVINVSDSGADSLRRAVISANGANGIDEMNLSASLSGQTITLSSGKIAVAESLIINGLAKSLLTISGSNASRIFNFADVSVTTNDLTLTSGTNTSNDDGATFSNFSNVILDNTMVLNSIKVNGGAICSKNGALNLSSSTISGNTSTRKDFVEGFQKFFAVQFLLFDDDDFAIGRE